VVLGKQLTAQEFGWFTVVNVLLLFTLALQAALIWQPQNVIYQLLPESERDQFLGSTQVAQAILIAVCSPVVTAALLLLGLGATASPALVLLWLGAWQLQEYTRRVQYARFRYKEALANDVLAYGLQPILLIAAALNHRLDASLAVGIITGTSLAGAFLGVGQRTLVRRLSARRHLISTWRYGRWLLVVQLGFYASVQVPILAAAFLLGARAAGEIRAALTVLGILNVPVNWLISTLPARLASALVTASDPVRILRRTYVAVMPLATLYCLVVAVFPEVFVRLMFNAELLPAAALVPAAALYYFVVLNSQFSTSVLQAVGATKRVASGYVSAAIVGLLIAFPLISALGAYGAVITSVIASVVWAVIGAHGAYRYLQEWRAPMPIGSR
jgi:O-antigen/teichoic acid export membrane protein